VVDYHIFQVFCTFGILPLVNSGTLKKLLLALLLLGVAFDATSQTLHAIMVSDVEDPKLGGVSLSDEAAILHILETAEWGTGLKLKTYYHNRSSFTASAIRETLENLRVRSRDVVFFYYTGLGYYPDATSQFPAFKLKESALRPLLVFFSRKPPLSLNEVGDILQQKGARLNVVMADCRDRGEDLMTYGGTTTVDEDIGHVFLKKLFLGSCGLVKVASAGQGKPVWANQGKWGNGSVYTGRFTSTIEDLLRAQFLGVRQATWPQVLKSSESIYIDPRKEGIPSSRQKAIYEIKSCTASQHRHTTRYASYRYSITAGGIEQKLNTLKASGGSDEKLTDEIRRAFRRNAKIELICKNKYPASDARAKRVTERMNIDQYFVHFKKNTDQIKYVGTLLNSVKRTPNKEYLTGLTFIETYDEL
jgi:hypothetical protein